MPSFKWRHASWVEELGIPCLTLSRPVKVSADGVTVRDAKGVRPSCPPTVILATGAKPSHELFHDSSGWWTNCTGRRRADPARPGAGDPGRFPPGCAVVNALPRLPGRLSGRIHAGGCEALIRLPERLLRFRLGAAVSALPPGRLACAAAGTRVFAALDPGARIGLIAREAPATMLLWEAGDAGIEVRAAPFPGFRERRRRATRRRRRRPGADL